MAYPIFPLDLLPIYLTGSIFSCVPPAVTRTVLPANLPVPSRECNSSVNQLTISSGAGSLPTPVTPQASQPASGCIIWYPKDDKSFKFLCTIGLLNISVFIAGHKNLGAGVAIIVVVSISSAIPARILPITLAVAGTTI